MKTHGQRRILITGAGGGIGQVIALQLVKLDHKVIVTDIQSQLDKFNYSDYKNVSVVPCNLENDDDVYNLTAVCKEYKIDSIIHVAGYGGPFQYINEFSLRDWDRVYAVNVRSLFLICHELVDTVAASTRGRIITIASIQGAFGSSGSSAYSSSKHAVIGLTKTIAAEFGQSLTANAISPGYIDTAMGADDTKVANYKKRVIDRTPTKTVGTSQQVADAVSFLLSDEMNYINGSVITIDGGITADIGIM